MFTGSIDLVINPSIIGCSNTLLDKLSLQVFYGFTSTDEGIIGE